MTPRRGIVALICWANLPLACGEGLHTRPRTLDSGDAGTSTPAGDRPHDAGQGIEATDAPADRTSGSQGEMSSGDAAEGGDADGSGDDGSASQSVTLEARAAGMVSLAEARLSAGSGTFGARVTLVLREIAPPRAGPERATFELEQQPRGIHASAALRFEIRLTAAQQIAPASYAIATYKGNGPWNSLDNQTYDGVDQAVGVDLFGLDAANITVALLRRCSQSDPCPRLSCYTDLCQ